MIGERLNEFGYRGFNLWREDDGFHGQRILTGTVLEGAPYVDRGAAMTGVDDFWVMHLEEEAKESS